MNNLGWLKSLILFVIVFALQMTVADWLREQEHALKMGLPADEAGNIIVQIDKNIPYDAMYKVMATCGFSGYTHIAFAVMQKNGGEE